MHYVLHKPTCALCYAYIYVHYVKQTYKCAMLCVNLYALCYAQNPLKSD